MKIKIDINDLKFGESQLPKLIQKIVLDSYNDLNRDSIKTMNTYLEKIYNMSLYDICSSISSYIKVTKYNSSLILTFSNDKIWQGNVAHTVEEMTRVIDNGNLQVKGLHIFDNSLVQLKQNIKLIYKYYIGGLRWQ